MEAVVGPVIDRAAVAQVTAKNLRNNDDALVRAANYPVGGSQITVQRLTIFLVS